jgi:hypothetical protein
MIPYIHDTLHSHTHTYTLYIHMPILGHIHDVNHTYGRLSQELDSFITRTLHIHIPMLIHIPAYHSKHTY